MALAIEVNNRMKRKAAAMGVFLNVETQKKFLKMASNVGLQEVLQHESNTLDSYKMQFEDLHCDFLRKDRENEWLRGKNGRLEEDVGLQAAKIKKLKSENQELQESYVEWCKMHDDCAEAERTVEKLKAENDVLMEDNQELKDENETLKKEKEEWEKRTIFQTWLDEQK